MEKAKPKALTIIPIKPNPNGFNPTINAIPNKITEMPRSIIFIVTPKKLL